MKRNAPLFLPVGSVRAILAIMFSTALIASAFGGSVSPDLAVLTGSVVAFYFGTRKPA